MTIVSTYASRTRRHTSGTSTVISSIQFNVQINCDHPRIDIATLRSKHHICGILTGTLPHLSQQNVFLGVPLVLMPEEVVLLVENGISYNFVFVVFQ
jgi:hypothetical protein